MKKTRVRLSYAQKRALCVRHKQHPDIPRQMLYERASAEFKLPGLLARSTLANALRDRACYEALGLARKASHKVHSPQLEVALVAWIDQCKRWKFSIATGAAIHRKAEKIRGELMQDPTTSESATFAKLEFPKGWLFEFQARHRLKSRRAHYEAGSVSSAAVDEGRSRLQSVTSGYDRRDTYNMDETMYFYCMSANKSATKSSIPGRKKIKKCITVAVANNVDGSVKTPLLFIGEARRPHCFENKTGEDITSHLQPQNAGVIRAFKARLEQLKTWHIVDRFDALLERAPEVGKERMEREIDCFYHVDVLEAMQ